MFAKANKNKVGVGRLYILQLTLDNTEVIHKIGMCYTPRSTDRMLEILRSWFMVYRYIPETRMKLDFETEVPYELDKHVHEILRDFKWVPDKKVDGAQEMFRGLAEREVIDYIRTVKL